MRPERITVFLPCHSLDDFPTWLDDADAEALLSAWVSAWHPWLIASVGAAPWWASVDLPPVVDGRVLGIVPAPWDDRFATQADAIAAPFSRWVRGVTGPEAIVAAAAAALAGDAPPENPLPGDAMATEFQALGLATLLAELLARRMRSHATAADDDFNAAVVAAARAAVAGDEAVARGRLAECYGCLEAARARYYPVDVWLVDLVLLAESTLGAVLDRELDSPVPLAVVATGQVVEKLAAANPAALPRIRDRMAAGTLEPAGGRYDSRPLDACAPEEILDSFARGMAAWRELVGSAPSTYAQCSGGSSAILPQLLAGLGFTGAVWPLFDGSPLPDPGAGRIRWEGTGGGCIDAIARPPLDARAAKTILSLPGRLGDAMDHDHSVVVHFAHHAGTASRWHDVLRRIGAATTALGTFVTPRQLFAKTEGTGTTVSFEPDAFPVMAPPAARRRRHRRRARGRRPRRGGAAARGPRAAGRTAAGRRHPAGGRRIAAGPRRPPLVAAFHDLFRWPSRRRACARARSAAGAGAPADRRHPVGAAARGPGQPAVAAAVDPLDAAGAGRRPAVGGSRRAGRACGHGGRFDRVRARRRRIRGGDREPRPAPSRAA
jgi:alpha-mannosidase